MIAVLSPAKKLVQGPARADLPHTTPVLVDDAAVLVEVARTLDAPALRKLMDISEKLATLNVERFSAMQTPPTPASARQAVATFAGDTYVGFDAATLTPDDLAYAQEHVAILSGLYGVLRPLDLVAPYRLEMGTRLDTPRGTGLYAFWGDRIARCLADRLRGHEQRVLVNLASAEYFGAVDLRALEDVRVVTPVFREVRDGKSKVISFLAKKARGRMARFLVEHRLRNVEALKAFDVEGYRFDPEASEGDVWAFHRRG